MAHESPSEYQGRKRALIVSVSQYDKLASLDFCEKDGNKMYEVLTQLGYEIPDKHRLIGGRVKYWKIHDAIIDFFYDHNIHPKDTILFYFSGHGVLGDDGEHYLSASDIDPDIPQGRGFSFDGLTTARGNCNSKTIFTILDCCYAGAATPVIGDEKGEDASANAAKNLIENKSKALGEGKCILSACKPMQKAYEFKEQGHSFFTFYLSEALNNRECVDEDGDVTPYKVNDYIDNRIRSLPAEMRPKQTPFLNCQTAGKIVIAHYPKEPDYLSKLLKEERVDEFNKIRKQSKEEEDIPLILRRLDLSGKSLSGVDLHEADLADTKLVNTKLTNANLKGTKLRGADLSGADLRSADLYGANLTGANLSKADLRGTDLKGMIDFSGANLTGAILRGADLTGMVNFDGAILVDVDFTGSVTDKGLINLAGAHIRNVKGLAPLQKPNEYLESLKFFSESIRQQFKINNIPTEELKPIEESMKELVKEVEDIVQESEEEISQVKKENINKKFVEVAEKVIKALPKTSETLTVFRQLSPFTKLIGEDIQQIVESSSAHPKGDQQQPQQSATESDIGRTPYQTVSQSPSSTTPKIKEDMPSDIPKLTEAVSHIDTTFSPSSSTDSPKNERYHSTTIERKKDRKKNNLKILVPIIAAAAVIGAIIIAFVVFGGGVMPQQPQPSIPPSPPSPINQLPPNATINQPSTTTNQTAATTTPGQQPNQQQEQYSFVRKWGSQGTADGQFQNPQGIAVDSSGNVYVADTENDRIQKFDSNGNFITKWGSQGTADGQFYHPRAIAVDSSGNVYVADTDNNRIQKLDSNGNFITKWGSQGTADGQFQYPVSIAVDSLGNVYTADWGISKIQKFDSNGNFIKNIGGAYGSTGIAIERANGYIYVEYADNIIKKFSSDDNFVTKWGSYGDGDGEFDGPYGIAVDSFGNVYVADWGNDRIQKFDSSGNFITKWGSNGTGDGQFYHPPGILEHPQGIAVDSSGNVYVTDSDNNRIQVFAPNK